LPKKLLKSTGKNIVGRTVHNVLGTTRKLLFMLYQEIILENQPHKFWRNRIEKLPSEKLLLGNYR
jgi:hypothetical protein